MSALERFIGLLASPAGSGCFNPWQECDPSTDASRAAADDRRARLRAHLATRARWLLVGEAAGYQGAKVSGIPFTSERLLLAGGVPRVDRPIARLSTRARPWSEPSATTVWSTLHALGIAEHTILWNAFPWHPHAPGQPHSNRTPTPAERERGRPVLAALLAAFPGIRLFAVGRQAESALAALGIGATPLRHPSMGGAATFRAGLAAALTRGRD